MEIRYDKEAHALYIRFRKEKVGKNRKLDDFTTIDEDDKGKILGVEFLDASKKLSTESLTEVKVKNLLDDA